MKFHEQLKKARREAGLKQIDVANALGVSPGAYSAYESGKRSPDVHKIHRLADILNVTGDQLLGIEESNTENKSHPQYTVEEKRLIDLYSQLGKASRDLVVQMINGLLQVENEKTPIELDMERSYTSYLNRPYFLSGVSAGSGNEANDDHTTIRIKETPEAQRSDYVLRVNGNSMEPMFYDGDLVLVKEQRSLNDGEIGIFVVDGESYIKQQLPGRLHSLNEKCSDVPLNEFSSIYTLGKVIGKAEV